ncbi:hypothetical protein [Haloarcula amylovorans]|uniref:hypothetical protein n=1 Tax=Haloarcula amylovorans TaxID=2562280 RepID=UPI001076B90C|nr:hypothetical protein [Halomicroarcula amylolytica]
MTQARNGSNDTNQHRDEQKKSAQTQQQPRQGDDSVENATSWFANAAVRTGLTLIGGVVLLFALGQAVGLPLLELVTDALTSQTGQWLVVAFFAVLLIGAAQKARPAG